MTSMTPREPLQAGRPKTFSQMVGPVFGAITGESDPVIHGFDGLWTLIKGAGLAVPIAVRVELSDDGRYVVTGLCIGRTRHDEITWQTLRSINLSRVIAELFADVDRENPYQSMRTLPEVGDLPEDEWPVITLADLSRPADAAAALLIADRRRGELPVPKPKVGGRGPSEAELRGFALTYERHYASQRKRATAATAKELSMSRATVIRNIARCRALGLLPSIDGGTK